MAIQVYIFRPFTVCVMTLKVKTFFLNFPQVTSALIYNRTSYIALMYKANMFTISFNSNKDLSNTGEQYACLPYIHKTHGRLLLV